MLWYRKIVLHSYTKGQPCPIMPVTWCRRVFNMVHSLLQSGLQAKVKLIGSKFVWAGLCKEVKEWVAACVACQHNKVHQHTKVPIEPFVNPTRCFDHMHVDMVGPLSPSQGFTHLLTVVDKITRWPEVVWNPEEVQMFIGVSHIH